MTLVLGEWWRQFEIIEAMDDLRAADCDVLTLGQYLQPSKKHLEVVEFITPEQFDRLGEIARSKGFVHVESGPMVANLVLAWLMDEVCEPIRIATTCALVPHIARKPPKKHEKEESMPNLGVLKSRRS